MTNLRFADDVMLISTSLEQAREMLEDLINEARKVGLEVHLGKTSLLSNGMDSNKDVRSIEVQGNRVEVVEAGASTMYLGRALSLNNSDDNELKHRFSRAWAKFGAYRNELINKKYSLFDRMRLFNAVVTPSVLYGCGGWTMTHERTQQLRSTQRKMLRTILGKGRRRQVVREGGSDTEDSDTGSDDNVQTRESITEEEVEESWVSWIQRTTREVVDIMAKVGMDDWVETQMRRKWRWCGHTLRREDGRWATKLLAWIPDRGQRSRGHPHTRWSDDILAFLQHATEEEDTKVQHCFRIASNRELWASLEEKYLLFCMQDENPRLDQSEKQEIHRLRRQV